MYPRNAASPERISVGAIYLIADGSKVTSGASATVTPQGGSETAAAGTLACLATSGEWVYTPTQAETNYTSFVVSVYKASCTSVSVTVVTSEASTPGQVVTDAASRTASKATGFAVAGDAMALTSGERTTLAAAIEAAIINEVDGNAVMQAIADLIADDMTTGDLTVAAIASACRDAILNRVLAGNHDAEGTPGKLFQQFLRATYPEYTITVSGTGTVLARNHVGSTLATNEDLATAQSSLDAILEDTGMTIPAQISNLNDIDSAGVQTAAAAALTAYDPPTEDEMNSALAALNDPTAAAIADAVWDEAYADHADTGTYGILVGAAFEEL